MLILTGFDAERTDQLIRFFEPEITLLGFQIGEQYSNAKLNLVRHEQCLDRWKALTNIRTFSLDAYSNDNGFKNIEPWIKKHIPDSNIVMSSLGPKPSAVARYHICKKYPPIALAYVPSKDYNLNYSYGLGSTITGKVRTKSQRKGK